jgi:hypothetical protein
MTHEDTPPASEPAPLEVRMRQGVPTRLDIDGVRTRFGLNTCRHRDQSVHFSVRKGDELAGFDVHEGDQVGALGRRWLVRELSVPESGTARVVLVQIPEPVG